MILFGGVACDLGLGDFTAKASTEAVLAITFIIMLFILHEK